MEADCGYLFNSSAIDYANSSNSSATECVNLTYSCTAFLLRGYTAFHIVMSIALAAVIIFNGLIAVVLLRATSVAVTVRVPLINLLVAALIADVMLLCGTLSSVVLAQGCSTVLLKVLLVVSPYLLRGFAEIASQLGMVVFSVVVFWTVTRGTTTIRVKWLIFSLVITWVIAILTTIVIYASVIYYILRPPCNEIHTFFIALSIMAMIAAACIIFVPLLLCFCVIVYVGTLCYIKRHTISEGAQYKKAMAKFAAFLITGNVLNVLDHVAHIAVISELLFANSLPFLYFTYIITPLSFIPTPILIVVFLKPVRKGLCCLFCSKYRRDNETIPMQQAETPL